MNSDPSYNSIHRRFNERNNNDEYHERFHLNQYYNAVEDEQIYMDEYTTLLHRYNDFIVNGHAMFNRMEQTLRENISRTHVRQSFYYHRSDELRRVRDNGTSARQQTRAPLTQPPASLNSMPPSRAAPAREQPSRPRDNTSPQPQLPSEMRLGEAFPRLLSRYFTSELNRESREINNGRENMFSMLYTVPLAVRANTNGAAGGVVSAGAPTNDQINRATLNTAFSNIVSPVNATCPICRDEFNDESEITMIRGCNHIFNRASLREWFVSHSTCPMCRNDIREYQVPNTLQEPSSDAANRSNISIDSVDQDHITFSYDLPAQYNNDQVYHDIINTISEMTQTSRRNDRNDDIGDNDDDAMDVD